MVEFLCPKLFTAFTLILNAVLSQIMMGKLPSIACIISAIFFTVNVIIFCVKSDVKLAFILNIVAFAISVLSLGYYYLYAIFSKYVILAKEKYEEIPYPTSYLDDLNFKARMFSIGLLTIIFVTNFTNMWVYKVNYDKQKTALYIPNQPILG